MEILVLQINHRHGTDLMASHEEQELWAGLESWAREWWHEVEESDEPPADMDGEDVVEQYFSHEHETWEMHCIWLADVDQPQVEPDSKSAAA